MGGVVRSIKKAVKSVVKTAVNVVQKAVSWITPSFPTFDASFGDTPMDNYEKGILLNKQSNDASIPVIYGERMLGGIRIFLETSGTNNSDLYMALVLCEGEINSIEQILVDDKLVTWASSLSDGTEVDVASSDSNFYKDGVPYIRVQPFFWYRLTDSF